MSSFNNKKLSGGEDCMERGTEMKKVAVIGAGPSGLTAIRWAVEEGFDVVCFEQEDDIGGLWRFTTDDSHSSVCKSTVINTSKEMMSYSDFPAPKDFPVYMPNVKVMEYLHLYVKHFNISRYIKFDTVVKSVKKSDDHDLTGKWDITFFPHGKEIIGQKCETFDFIFVCTGHHWIKNLPHFDGIDDFKGKKIHSKQYKDFKGYEDKRVLVIGIGNSGGDISVELSRHAKQVFLSTRRGAWVFPRMAHGGYPSDQFKNRRIMSLIPKSVVEIVGQKIANDRFDHKKFGLKPEHGATQQHPMVNDDLPSRISTGRLKIKPNVKLIKEKSVVFEDNTEAADLDAIIFATGYKIGFPCLEEGLVPVERNQVPLYKYVFPDSHKHHTMAILGCLQPIGAIMPLSELQARWACKVFSGTKCLPSLDEMKADTERKRKAMLEHYYQADRHTIQVDYIDYADEIAREIGCKPNFLKLLFKDPSLAFSCLFGPCVPYQYRLMGPDPWDGAKKAIEAVEENIIFPTRTRIVSKTNETGVTNKTCLVVAFIFLMLAIAVAVLCKKM
ncbi:flavin-containing monooxygenase 5-like [Rhopilema esculentum]|uniref:flavin-containing monooxygenase 5-like n=1 Tax=Rhopilema esculentum TaxID=499914 RepID=UPI0031D87C39